jgi:D-tyrosyl-tRNA(Tyr) deacylase
MRILLQRVSHASVHVEGKEVAAVGTGWLALVGFGEQDDLDLPGSKIWRGMIDKMLNLRVFPDEAGKLNLSLLDIGGALLLVSQFTLYADCRKGRRPSFHGACPPQTAQELYDRFCDDVEALLPGRVGRGIFGADMKVGLLNDGPVTIYLDDSELFGLSSS